MCLTHPPLYQPHAPGPMNLPQSGAMIVLLDTGPLGHVTHPRATAQNAACWAWMAGLARSGALHAAALSPSATSPRRDPQGRVPHIRLTFGAAGSLATPRFMTLLRSMPPRPLGRGRRSR
jgi:hypothetical protein